MGRTILGAFYFTFLTYLFWPHHMVFKILVPGLGMEPVLPTAEAPSPNHWTAREFPSEISERLSSRL